MNALLVDCYVVYILYIFDVLVYICFHLVTGEVIYRRSLLSYPFDLKSIKKYLKLNINNFIGQYSLHTPIKKNKSFSSYFIQYTVKPAQAAPLF